MASEMEGLMNLRTHNPDILPPLVLQGFDLRGLAGVLGSDQRELDHLVPQQVQVLDTGDPLPEAVQRPAALDNPFVCFSFVHEGEFGLWRGERQW